MSLQKFKEQFNKVFDKDFNVRSCGREEVIKLIELANKLDDTKNYGNLVTGFMCKDDIITLYKELSK